MSIIARVLKKRGGHEAPKVRGRATAPRLESLEPRTLLSTTYTVTNQSADRNIRGSLPWAVHQSNYTTRGLDYITFNIPGAGVHSIILNDVLYLNEQVVIDGTSQPGYNRQTKQPLVYVQGGSATPSLFVLNTDPSQGTKSSGSTIQGLGMHSFTANAVTIFSGSDGNYVQDNWMGFYFDGTNGPYLTTFRYNDTLPNPLYPAGVSIQSNLNVIRGNTISGVYTGVNIGSAIETTTYSKDYASNSIQGNNIGTDPTGSTTVNYGTLQDGIFLAVGARRNYLGPDNVISGFRSIGVELLHPTVSGNVIFRNRIGTNKPGTAAIGNGKIGVLVANGASGNAVGATGAGGNVISGNSLGGVVLGTGAYPVATGNWVQSNIIGLNGSQTNIIGMQDVGLTVESRSRRNVIEGNVLAGHRSHGLLMSNTESNYVSGNWIGRSMSGVWYANGGYGVALTSGASFNYIYSTFYGNNLLGPRYVDPGAVGNDIRGS